MPAIAVTGSIATDHLMRFPGRFAEQLLPDQLHTVSLSFLVDDLVIRRGGVAANIAFGMAQLGERPILVGAVGTDFTDYRSWLERHGVDCAYIHVSQVAHTARFICTTDTDMCQIASFYTGAMAESVRTDLAAVSRRAGGLRLALISADDPTAMLQHATACRQHGIPFAADPSQQLARMSSAQILQFIDGADYLLTNEYEHGLLIDKCGLTPDEILCRVGTQAITLGERGVRIVARGHAAVEVPAAKMVRPRDPTGGGDAFRAGFFTGLARGLSITQAAQIGCQLAAYALETVGTQEYVTDAAMFCHRLAHSYGEDAAVRLWECWPGIDSGAPAWAPR